MAWIIASVPFWLLGAWLLIGAFCCACGYDRKPHETTGDLAGQLATGLILAGIFFAIAAKVAS